MFGKTSNKHLKYYEPQPESKHNIYLDTNNLYSYPMFKFLLTNGFEWIDHKEFNLSNYNGNSSKGCALKVYLEYSKELCELQGDYLLAPGKIEIKREMLSNYQLKIVNIKRVNT